MSKRLVPVIIKSPWLGELNAQIGVAAAIVADAKQHVMIPDVFWRSELEKKFKQAKREQTKRQAAGQASIHQALNVVSPWCSSLDSKRDIPVIINMGGRDSAAILSLAVKYLYPQSFLMNILYPKLASSFYDLLALPPCEPRQETKASTTIQIGSIPNTVCEDNLRGAKELWTPILRSNNKKTLSVIVGGNVGLTEHNNLRPFTVDHGSEFARQIKQIHENTDCNLVLTTSRRTPPEVAELLQNELSPICSYSYFHNQNLPNPYIGFMACADAFVVTADSMSMLSEAADTGRRVYSFCPDGTLTSDHIQFYNTLVENGHVIPLSAPIEFGPGRPVRAAARIAETVIGMIEGGYSSQNNIHQIVSGEYALN